jgi:hypothetical protein
VGQVKPINFSKPPPKRGYDKVYGNNYRAVAPDPSQAARHAAMENGVEPGLVAVMAGSDGARLQHIFDTIDRDKSGAIDFDEVRATARIT